MFYFKSSIPSTKENIHLKLDTKASRSVMFPCTGTIECLENGFCNSNNTCVCAAEFYYDSIKDKCLKLKSHGDSCDESSNECNGFTLLKCISG